MTIQHKGHKERKDRAEAFWGQVWAEFNNGMTPLQIARKYINPVTGKNYNRSTIYWILSKFK